MADIFQHEQEKDYNNDKKEVKNVQQYFRNFDNIKFYRLDNITIYIF